MAIPALPGEIARSVFGVDREDTVSGMEARLRINESVIRFLTVRRDEEKRTAERLAARIAKRKKQESADSGVLGSYDEDMDLE